MIKTAFILFTLLNPLILFAHETQEFELTGHYCANPYYYDGPSESGARADADNQAIRLCYPYQFRRTSDYEYVQAGRCQNQYYGSAQKALYVCAQPSPATKKNNEPSLEECRRTSRQRKG
ncbi:MAG: hypothetical protein EOP06_27830, partial [Proteobacteria bacterium]